MLQSHKSKVWGEYMLEVPEMEKSSHTLFHLLMSGLCFQAHSAVLNGLS